MLAQPCVRHSELTTGNAVEPLVDGAATPGAVRRPARRGPATRSTLPIRADTEELLSAPAPVDEFSPSLPNGCIDLRIGDLSRAGWTKASKNAELVRKLSDAGGEVLLDARTRRADPTIRSFSSSSDTRRPERDVAFVVYRFGTEPARWQPARRRPQAMTFLRLWRTSTVARRAGRDPRPRCY